MTKRYVQGRNAWASARVPLSRKELPLTPHVAGVSQLLSSRLLTVEKNDKPRKSERTALSFLQSSIASLERETYPSGQFVVRDAAKKWFL